MKIQFVVSSDETLIDYDADEYYLLFDFLFSDKFGKEKKISLVNRESDAESYIKKKEYISDLTRRVIKHYGDKANRALGIELSERQWRICFQHYIEEMLSFAYEHYLYICQIPPDAYINFTSENTIWSTWRLGGSRFIYIDKYCGMFIAILMKMLNRQVNEVCDNRKRYHVVYDGSIETTPVSLDGVEYVVLDDRMKDVIKDGIKTHFGDRVVFFTTEYFDRILSPIISKTSPSIAKRKAFFSTFTGENAFEKCINYLLCCYIPVSSFEAFEEMYYTAAEISDSLNLRKIYHSANENEFFLLMSALASRKKTLICDIQHSAVYEQNGLICEPECNSYDRFISWGWTSTRYNNIRAVAINTIYKKTKTVSSKKRILFAINAVEKDALRGWTFYRYTRKQANFIDELDQNNRSCLVVRHRGGDAAEELVRYCKSYPEVEFENAYISNSFEESLKNSSLLICDYFSTTVIEALIRGYPVMFYNGVDIIEEVPDTRELFNTLREYGVFFDNEKDLADRVLQYDKTMNHLVSSEVKNVIERVVNRMCNYHKDLINEWIWEIEHK